MTNKKEYFSEVKHKQTKNGGGNIEAEEYLSSITKGILIVAEGKNMR
jgi:hypothetical protein